MPRRFRSFTVAVAAVLTLVMATPIGAQRRSVTNAAAAAIGNVASADGAVYQATTSNGLSLDALKIIQGPAPGRYIGVFHVAEPNGMFMARLALSNDLRHWSAGAVLSTRGSMPTIAAVNGHYLVAFELADATGKSQIALEYFPSYQDLLRARPARTVQLARHLSRSNEGTPSFHSIRMPHGLAGSRIVLGFHYNSGRDVDRNGIGVLVDFSRWSERDNAALNEALEAKGVRGSIGARSSIHFDGTRVQLVEGQQVVNSWSAWGLYAYQPGTRAATRVPLATPRGSRLSIGVPRASAVTTGAGRAELVLTAFVYQEGSPSDLNGELIWWRSLPR